MIFVVCIFDKKKIKRMKLKTRQQQQQNTMNEYNDKIIITNNNNKKNRKINSHYPSPITVCAQTVLFLAFSLLMFSFDLFYIISRYWLQFKTKNDNRFIFFLLIFSINSLFLARYIWFFSFLNSVQWILFVSCF